MKRCTKGLAHLREDLGRLADAGLLRQPAPPAAREALAFCSNDYLGLAGRSPPPSPSGAGASRLVSGDRHEHAVLEAAINRWLEVEASLVFSSGYAANVGALAALAGPGDLVVSDELNHASIIDGARLCRARIVVVPHNDVGAVRSALEARSERRAWVVTESYFSMDADGPDLRALHAVCDENEAALVVDEAHALGVLGPDGRGRCAEAGIAPDVLIGTFGKALGAGGAFVAGSADLRLWLWNRARPFVFSTGLSPSLAAAASDAIGVASRDGALRATVAARAGELRDGMMKAGLRPVGFGHVVPLVIGDPRRAVRLARLLLDRGIFVQAIRPPSVPEGTARLRFTVTAAQSAADIQRALDALQDGLRCLDA